jgi:hypothetical protein
VDQSEIVKIQAYLQAKFGNPALEVRPRPRKTDSCEVYLGEEFIGVIYLDDEDGDRSFSFQMAILDVDLDEVG